MLVWVALLLRAIHAKHPWQEWLWKPLAAATFVAASLRDGVPQDRYGQTMVAGLVLAAIGDVCLIPKDRRAFLAGLVAFLLGHVAYTIAFLERGVLWEAAAMVGGVALVASIAIVRWLWPHLRSPMHPPVLAYVVVITSMVAISAGTFALSPDARIPIGALMFYLSDLAVAREAFVAKSFTNRAWGLPLYFAAQLVLAWTV